MEVERFAAAHGKLAVRFDAPEANRVLLALERLDQQGGIDPILSELREALRGALVAKSSGDTDSAPSTE